MARALPKTLTDLELEQILAQPSRKSVTGKRNGAILEVMAWGCLRRADIVQLKREDFRESRLGPVLEVRKSKSASPRIVPLRPRAFDAVTKWLAVAPDSEWLFCTTSVRGGIAKGNPVGSPLGVEYVWQIVKRYAKAAGITRNTHPHMFRHTGADWLLRPVELGGLGLSIYDVSDTLGHESIDTTAVYLRLHPEHRARAIYAS